MIVCGWCRKTTEPGLCSHCGRDSALPWTQRGQEPPAAGEAYEGNGRPRLTAATARHRLRLAAKELGVEAPTQAQLAEHLDVDVKTVARWQKLSA